MADALVWQLVRNNNSFLVKRGGGGPKGGNASRAGAVQFSREPGNILGVNSFKYSGLANAKAVDIQTLSVPSPTDKSAFVQWPVLKTKATKKANLIKKSVESKRLSIGTGTTRGLKVIAKRAGNNFYRKDLVSAAGRKFQKLRSGALVQMKVIKGARPKAGRNTRA